MVAAIAAGRSSDACPLGWGLRKRASNSASHVRADGKAARHEARPDGGPERRGRHARGREPAGRRFRDPLPRSAPAAVEKRAARAVLRHDRDGGAIRRRHRNPWDRPRSRGSRPPRTGRPWAGRGSARAPDGASWAVRIDPSASRTSRRFSWTAPLLSPTPRPRLRDRRGPGSRRRRAGAWRTGPRREAPRGAAPRARGGEAWQAVHRHGAQSAFRALAAQALLRRPRALRLRARAHRDLRRRSPVSIPRRGGAGRACVPRRGHALDPARDAWPEGPQHQWAAVDDSVVVAAYVGPIRTLDALHSGRLAVHRDAPLRSRPLRARSRPKRAWGRAAFASRAALGVGTPWQIRESLERATAEPVAEGWRIAGTLNGEGGGRPFVLELSRKLEPRRLVGRRRERRDASLDPLRPAAALFERRGAQVDRVESWRTRACVWTSRTWPRRSRPSSGILRPRRRTGRCWRWTIPRGATCSGVSWESGRSRDAGRAASRRDRGRRVARGRPHMGRHPDEAVRAMLRPVVTAPEVTSRVLLERSDPFGGPPQREARTPLVSARTRSPLPLRQEERAGAPDRSRPGGVPSLQSGGHRRLSSSVRSRPGHAPPPDRGPGPDPRERSSTPPRCAG